MELQETSTWSSGSSELALDVEDDDDTDKQEEDSSQDYENSISFEGDVEAEHVDLMSSRPWWSRISGVGASGISQYCLIMAVVFLLLVVGVLIYENYNTRTVLHQKLEEARSKQCDDASSHSDSKQKKYSDQRFLEIPNSESIKGFSEYLSKRPHVAGTARDYETAQYFKQQVEAYGFSAEIESYSVLLSSPVRRRVALVSPLNFECSLHEPSLSEDATSNETDIVATFNAYSPSGNITGTLLYANYGTLEDFQTLEHLGINLEGKIAIVRYGRIFRGLKVMLAQERKMKGVLIYSDPKDDGDRQGTAYPAGPWRPKDGVQRGSAQYLSLYAGDPQTPGYASKKGVERISLEESNIPRIPVQPLSAADAKPLLQALNGFTAPSKDWIGGIEDVRYNIGPGEAVVNIDIEMNFTVSPIWNVIASIEGGEEGDRSVILGNHRDAWVFGAADPVSGTATLLELARGFGKMLSEGWRPRRNVILASWDAEEYGLVLLSSYIL